MRHVGVEIEFMGLTANAAADALARDLGGSISSEDPHAFRINGTRIGNLLVETDLRYAHPARYPNLRLRLPPRAAAWLGTLVEPFVPRELITVPLPVARLPEVDAAVASLQAAGARGRGVVLWDALGLHFNIDPPSLDAETVTAYLKAFLLLSDHFRGAIARGRRRLALILPPDYPHDYKRLVLHPDYRPSVADLTRDYLAANPTRRRALDLLPLLAHFDRERVRSLLPHEKIGPRPVFHYRLPLAYPGDPAWSILPDWSRWLDVERLASDTERLAAMARDALSRSARFPPPI
ncbi:amidoligase family protein [Microvirga guangxiensis]|uniref:Putative amidoligase enzyme n=1 Tax=Microvirga guangxiensis TaxID=549386 RepID=A0A1G5KEG3_9HYPH|nr:amidoligase family protein [Microvirga guangxiensis]SCY98329.1 Putative amidoligase enzyme [Microvirga guangxiensis]